MENIRICVYRANLLRLCCFLVFVFMQILNLASDCTLFVFDLRFVEVEEFKFVLILVFDF